MDLIGEVVGHFRLVSKIGRGGMGDVFLAEHTTGGTRVAIKILKSDLSADAEYVQRLFNEARAVNEIRHAGVVQVFDVGIDDQGRAFLVMELLHGETLGQRLAKGARLTLDQVASIGRQIAVILAATHAVGITHRDLKPENIFLIVDPTLPGGVRVKILDFGIAKLTGSLKGGFPTTQVSLGTPAYMAPEQWGDPSKIDGRVDLYALGCVLFEMACGRPPFPSSTMAEACAAHVGQPPPRARTIAAHVPAALDGLIDRLLAKSATTRALPQEVVQVCDELARGSAPTMAVDPRATQLTGVPLGHGTPAALAQQPPPLPEYLTTAPTKPRGQRTLIVVLALVAIAAVAVAVVVVATSGDADTPAKPEGKIDLRANRVEPPPPGRDARMQEAVDAIAQVNPWIEIHGVPILSHLVTHREYALFLAALPPAEQKRATPLFRFDPATPTVLRWVTWEQAHRFCAAIDGKLLTTDRWETLVGRDDQGRLRSGAGYREWTSTRTNDGRRFVRGAFSEMSPDAIEAERPWQIPWNTEASNGGREPIENVASTQIAFRCTK